MSRDVTSFKQTLTYDHSGRVTSLGYPSCEADCTQAGPTITNTYTNGALTAVSSFAASITYHPNGTVNDVTFANAAHWIQVDPSIDDPDLRRPQTWSRYSYVQNSPTIALIPTERLRCL